MDHINILVEAMYESGNGFRHLLLLQPPRRQKVIVAADKTEVHVPERLVVNSAPGLALRFKQHPRPTAGPLPHPLGLPLDSNLFRRSVSKRGASPRASLLAAAPIPPPPQDIRMLSPGKEQPRASHRAAEPAPRLAGVKDRSNSRGATRRARSPMPTPRPRDSSQAAAPPRRAASSSNAPGPGIRAGSVLSRTFSTLKYTVPPSVSTPRNLPGRAGGPPSKAQARAPSAPHPRKSWKLSKPAPSALASMLREDASRKELRQAIAAATSKPKPSNAPPAPAADGLYAIPAYSSRGQAARHTVVITLGGKSGAAKKAARAEVGGLTIARKSMANQHRGVASVLQDCVRQDSLG
ncbi:hypothetical protein DIPPA_23259 [Diplonema papillatum]|nr:hypothetical protein DIPPA_23259 [Diplonema papillatum]